MSLSSYPVAPVIAVSEMENAKQFYEEKLGLPGVNDDPDGGRTYGCGGGSVIHVYPSPDDAGTSTSTQAGWLVDDIERVVDELSARGVTFEQYDEPLLRSDEKRITTSGDVHRAWFKDPDGNTFAVTQVNQE